MRDTLIMADRWRQHKVIWQPAYAPLSQNRLIRIEERFNDILQRVGESAVCYRVDWEAGTDQNEIKKLISYYQRLHYRNNSKFHFILAIEKGGFNDLHFHAIFLFDSKVIDLPNTILNDWTQISGTPEQIRLQSTNPDDPREFAIGFSDEIASEAFRVCSYLTKQKTRPPKDEVPNAFISSHLKLITHFEWISTSRIRRDR